MSSRAIKPKREGGVQGSSWQSIAERAPSVMREEGPSFPRYVAVGSLMLVTLGAASLLFSAGGKSYAIPPGLGFFMLACGLTGLLFHAYSEKDFQFRRLYGAVGFLLVLAAAFLRLAPIGGSTGGGFLPYGALSLLLSLGFLLSFVKNESDLNLRRYGANLVLLVGLANSLTGFIGGGLLGPKVSETFLTQTGVIHLVLGLLFIFGFVLMEGISTARGFWAGRAIGILGLAMILVGLGRSLWPSLANWLNVGGRPAPFFLPVGLILLYIGVEYLAVYLSVCSDNKIVVLTRRELGSFFYSPIAYIVMIGMALVGCLNYLVFVLQLLQFQMLQEPIFFDFMFTILAVIPMIFLVPIITMRMVSEEKRTGTLEVLLTAPVNEWHVVVAKFLAGLRVFTICWYLWGVFLIALWVETKQPYDYRPIITFLIALFCMGAGFVAMGVFFSSITSHQIVAAVFCFVMMMAFTLLIMVKGFTADKPWLNTVISYVSYLDLWLTASRSTITPRLLILHLSLAVMWLFMTVKVLEARKWS